MLKTGLKSFVYSFSMSLFTIVSVNRVFFYEIKPSPSSLKIQNKNITLYLTDTKPLHLPVKKIALNSVPEIPKELDTPSPVDEPTVITASNLAPLSIPLEFVEDTPVETKHDIPKENPVVLADVLYAPDKPLPIPEIKAKPIYEPEHIEVKIASAPKLPSNQKDSLTLKSSNSAISANTHLSEKKDDSLLLARNEKIDTIPLSQTKNGNLVNKIQVGDPSDLRHVAFADNSAAIQSMAKQEHTNDKEPPKEPPHQKPEWKQMNDSPWVIAKSSGGKNLFANKDVVNTAKKDIKDLIPLQKNKKGVQIASETAKNLIIPIPDDILNEKDITPQLAYPETSEDKQKEIDINEKIKEAQKKKEALDTANKEKEKDILTPIEDSAETDNTVVEAKTTPNLDTAKKEEKKSPPQKKESIMNALSSLFDKTAKTVSDAKDVILEKTKSKKTSSAKKRVKKEGSSILPTEIRLSFQPNRAEISGQTLRWIQAFATKTAKTPGLSLEIRIDGTSSTKLQQKRLNLLYNILTNKGVDYSMIDTVFTNRDPNSFILRTITKKDNNQGKVNDHETNRYIQW